MDDRVTLILGQDRIEAIREHLISKSKYFASLFSPNFRDSLSNEHRINYDIDTKTLRTFVSWASEDETSPDSDYRHMKPSLARYTDSSADFDDILRLVHLSVLFAAEALDKDLTDLITCHWLSPERSIQIWLVAKELNLTMLRDLAQATCMERLSDVPESLLLELSGEDFMSLLGNVHVQGHPDLLLHLVQQWKLRYISCGKANSFELCYPFTLSNKHLFQLKYKKKFEEQKLKNNLQCVVGHKLSSDNAEKACIYCWNGNTFSELVEFRAPPASATKNIIGNQAVGRGFDVYLVGGEYGLGTGRFEMEIWRYSTISKTWYYITSLPEPRRHMAVQFLNEELFIIGGVGRHRLKLSTVAVYNIYTGGWSKAADVPEDFTSIPPIFKMDENLAIYKSLLHTYDPKSNSWMTSAGQFHSSALSQEAFPPKWICVQFLMVNEGQIYIVERGDVIRPRIWMVEALSDGSSLCLGNCATSFINQVANGPYLVGFSCEDQTIFVEVMKLGGTKLFETILVHSEKKSDLRDLCFNAPIGCFNVCDPNSLHEQFNVLDS